MKRIIALALCVIFVLSLVGCNAEKEDDGKISIVVTAFPHYDFARQLTKNVENVEIKMLVSPGNEVHSYEPSPSDILAISSCDVFIYTGGESETWVDGILSSAGNDGMKVVSFMEALHLEHDHDSLESDEHVWTRPDFVLHLSDSIKTALVEKDEKNSAQYIKNAEEFSNDIVDIILEFDDIRSNMTRNEIIVADRFPFYHLAKAFEFGYDSAYPGCSHSTEPSAQTISELAKKVRDENIKYVFTIEFSNGKIAKSVTEGTDAEILTLHSCHNVSKEDFEKGITYYDLMMQNAANLRKALCE